MADRPRGRLGGASPAALQTPAPNWTSADGLADQRFAGFVGTLRRARRRAGTRALLESVLLGVVIGLALFCLLTASNWILAGLSPAFSFEWLALPNWLVDLADAPIPHHIVVSAIAALAAFLALETIRYRRHSDVDGMAIAADRRYEAAERLSTAMGLARRREATGVVGEALMVDALAWAERVDERHLVPWRVPTLALAIPVLLVLALGLVWLSQIETDSIAVAPSAPPAEAAVPAVEPDRVELAADLRAIAAILAQDGRSRSDPILQGIASELNDLGREVATNSELEAATLATELERLRDLAEGAYERIGLGEEDAGNNARLIQNALDEVAVDAAPLAAANPEETPPAAPPEEDDGRQAVGLDGGEHAPGGAVIPPAGLDVDVEDLAGDNDAPGVVQANPRGAAPLVDYDTPYDDGGLGDRALPQEGELIGVGDGFAGDQAGLGQAELFGPDGTPITPGEIAGQVVLVDDDPANGRMIRLNLPPIADLMGVDGEGLDDADGWRQFDEQEVQRAAVPAAAREAVGRYFQAMNAGQAE